MEKIYNNYHKHTHYSNIRTLDVVAKPIDYIKRAKELGHTTYFTTEHGFGGNVYEAYTLCKENDLKCIFGVEAYYVDDRLEKDRGNYHIILIAKNNDGRKDINRIMSKANTDGYYYKPRIDLKLLLSLNPKNVFITTACVGGRLFKTEDYINEFLMPVFNHFKENLYLEVQSHDEAIQKEWNEKVIKLSNKFNISIIHANDSHYIDKKDSIYRDKFLNAKGMFYQDESNFVLDYPGYDEIVRRYKKQGILNEKQIEIALDNTLIFNKCEDLGFTKDFKIPKIHKGDSNKILKNIIAKEFKIKSNFISKQRIDEYKQAIKDEVKTVIECGMSDYFILDYEIVKRSKEKYNATLTKSGRGSSVSFYINKVLGLTEVDRLKAPITLYPSRFMTAERILKSKSIPDIDLNFSDVSPVIQASKDILGEDGIYYMIAYKPLQESSAFRLWCKSEGMNISEYNEVAKNLDEYLEDEYWGKIIEDSKVFRGVIESVAPSPCSFLLSDKPISEEVGLIKVGNEICCCLDGYQCDQWKFLKNDYLTVSVYKLISETYKAIGSDNIDSIEELLSKVDDSVWDLYKDGITATLNQADSNFARNLVMKYSPRTLAELSAWVAAIRPGFASLLNKFLNREKHTTGVKELDELLKDSYCYMLYQESIMKFLSWLGIPEKGSYDILKKIAKKKFTEKELEELKEELKNNWIDKLGNDKGFDENWQVVEDAARYSFNASHALSVAIDSLYGAYLKRKHTLEYMTVAFNNYEDDVERTSKLTKELEYFNIKLSTPKFRYSKAEYMFDRKTNSIYKGVKSIKYLNEECANQLYELRNNEYNTFLELLVDLKAKKINMNSRQLEILIKLDYFSEFGKSKKLLKIVEDFDNIYGRKQISKKDLEKYNINSLLLEKYSNKITTKLYKEIDTLALLKEKIKYIKDEEILLKDKLSSEIEYLGYPSTIIDSLNDPLYYTKSIDKFENKKGATYYLDLYNIKNGEDVRYKITNYEMFSDSCFTINEGNIIKINQTEQKPKKRKNKDTGGWEIIPNEFNTIILDWEVY